MEADWGRGGGRPGLAEMVCMYLQPCILCKYTRPSSRVLGTNDRRMAGRVSGWILANGWQQRGPARPRYCQEREERKKEGELGNQTTSKRHRTDRDNWRDTGDQLDRWQLAGWAQRTAQSLRVQCPMSNPIHSSLACWLEGSLVLSATGSRSLPLLREPHQPASKTV